jgi:predicted Ser/Thr protein kinase
VKKVLGQGAMGMVYLGEDPVIGREVAIKVILSHPGVAGKDLKERQARFESEFRSAGTLAHPNVVSIYDVGQEDQSSFIAMEYVPGESLDTVLESDRHLSLKEVSDIGAQLASALDYAAGQGVVHRDVKPANILMTTEGRPKITDFGVAKLNTSNLTTTGTIIGTPMYMSPEQVTGHTVTGLSDQFSLAVILYEMLSGDRPFTGKNATTVMYKIVHQDPPPLREIVEGLPDGVDAVLRRGMEKEAGNRYPTCMELAEALRESLGTALADATLVVHKIKSSEAETVLALPLAQGGEQDEPVSKQHPKKGGWLKTASGVLVVVALALGGWKGWSLYSMSQKGDGDPTAIKSSGEQVQGVGLVPAAVSFEGTVSVIAEPAGAEIWVDGADRGVRAPAEISLKGSVGDRIQLELRQDGSLINATQIVLGPDMPKSWGTSAQAEPTQPSAVAVPSPVQEVLRITSEPDGAQVLYDGERLGTVTPTEVTVVSGTLHRVSVQLPGYEPAGRRFKLEDLSESQRSAGGLHFNLKTSIPPATLLLQASYDFKVEVAGREHPAARRHQISLPPGDHAVKISAPEVFYFHDSVQRLSSSETTEIPLPPTVPVSFAATPSNCRVTVDGKDIGFVPVTIDVVVGGHEFQFQWTNLGKSDTFREQVRPSTTRIFRAAPE